MKEASLRYAVVMCFLLVCLALIGIQLFDAIQTGHKLKEAKETQQIKDIFFWGRFWQVAAIVGGSLVVFACAVLVVVWSWGYLVQKLTHHARVGNSDIPIHHKDLRSMSPMIGGLVSVKGIAAQSKTEAFHIYAQAAKDFLALAKKNTSGQIQPSIQQALPAAVPVRTPTFSELIEDGKIGPGKPLIFGYTQEGYPHKGTWEDLFSAAMAGQSGSGKTYSERYIIASSLLSGEVERFIILDYAYPHPKSLLSKLGKLKDSPRIIAFDPERMFDKGNITAFLRRHVERELDHRIHHTNNHKPVVLVTDETLQLCKLCPYLTDLIFRVGTEGRKTNFYGLFSAHNWKGGLVGGTEVRDSLTSYLVHNMRRGAARTFLQDADLAKRVVNLPPGQALFSPTRGGAEILTIPKTSDLDMEYVFSYLGSEERPGTQTQAVLSPEHILQLLQESCEARGSSMSKNQWQAQTAKALKVSPSLIKNIMLGHADLTEEMCVKIAGYFQVENL
jgi:hypothetical protein